VVPVAAAGVRVAAVAQPRHLLVVHAAPGAAPAAAVAPVVVVVAVDLPVVAAVVVVVAVDLPVAVVVDNGAPCKRIAETRLGRFQPSSRDAFVNAAAGSGP